ncbi:MAG TPA: protein kinase, partial [Gaiellaceae bacterium]
TLGSGRYRRERVLGEGGMASVYLARDVELDRLVALKLLAGRLDDEAAFRERFLREARLAARLLHPNIVQVFDVGEDEGRPYIVMEFVEGETLAKLLARRRALPAAEAVELALQVCAGLEHAHEHGLVHRDVKPANLLVRADGVVKIADFGIAHAAESTRLTQVGTVLGTAAYLSPEQAAGEPVSAKADLYSLGAVLYETLTGRVPYEPTSLAELPLLQQRGPTSLRELEPAVPPGIEEAVMRCLARNPDYRPGSAAELAGGLAAAAPDARTKPLPVPAAPGRTRRFGRTRRPPPLAGLVAGGLLVAVLLALGGWSLAGGGGHRQLRQKSTIAAPPRGESGAQEAANLRDWLRANSR